MLVNQSHPTIRHRLSAAAWGHLATVTGYLSRLEARTVALAVGALMAGGGLVWLGDQASAHHPAPVAAAPHLGSGSMAAEVAFAYVDGLPGLTATGSPTVLDNDWSTATVAVPVSPHRSALVVVDDLVRAPGHLFGRWVVVDHWLPPAGS